MRIRIVSLLLVFVSICFVVRLSYAVNLEDYRRPASIPFPANNPYTPTKAALGKALYFDPRLSGGQNMNCASCHNPSFGWEVPLPGAIGSHGEALARRANTILNLAWSNHFFWDGRASSLEEQARGPIEAAVEMNLPLEKAVKRLSSRSCKIRNLIQINRFLFLQEQLISLI